MAEVVEVLVSGGNANPGPPLGPALGPLGINIKQVVEAINAATTAYAGMQVPVKVKVADDKTFSVEVGTPPTSSLLFTEVKVQKGSGTPNSAFIGNVTMDQLVKIARMKKPSTLATSLKAAVKEAVGTCGSVGITVDGKPAKQAMAAIEAGEYDKALSVEY